MKDMTSPLPNSKFLLIFDEAPNSLRFTCAAKRRQVQHLLAGEPAFPPDETGLQCL